MLMTAPISNLVMSFPFLILPTMLALCLMLLHTNYAQNYARTIRSPLFEPDPVVGVNQSSCGGGTRAWICRSGTSHHSISAEQTSRSASDRERTRLLIQDQNCEQD